MIRDPEAFGHFIDRLRAFVRKELVPHEAEVAARDEVPPEIVQRMRGQGLFGYSIPAAYGGAGMTTEELILAALELSQCAVAFRARVGTNTGIGAEALVADGTPAQKDKYLPMLASGAWTSAFALTEPEAGSDACALRTRALRDADHYLISGSKCFITNAPIAQLFTVLARTDPAHPGAGGISAFLVERDTPGLVVGKPYQKMGQAGSPVAPLYFDNCRVPAANLIGGQEGRGFKTAMKVLNKQRIHLAALCIGPAMRMLQEAVQHRRAPPVRPAGGQLSVGAGHGGRLPDRNPCRPRTGAGDGTPARPGAGRGDAGVDVQVLRLRNVRPRGRPLRADARRLRLHCRQPGRALLPRRAPVSAVRGHQPDPPIEHCPAHLCAGRP